MEKIKNNFVVTPDFFSTFDLIMAHKIFWLLRNFAYVTTSHFLLHTNGHKLFILVKKKKYKKRAQNEKDIFV